MKTDNYDKIKLEASKRTGEALEANRVFFAFSNEQFEESKTKLDEGDKYVSIGSGGYIPFNQLKSFAKAVDDNAEWFKNEVKSCKEEHILAELINYECFYTGSVEDAMGVLAEHYTIEEVNKVFKENNH